ncbi:ArsO family NAD(P)H-dependent flavin-containing monooxygenase [Ensifer adhaerens]|uniref:ArsO family NAD(P)H-dependent flavin-containing monooxygenase n=1 Tax=Ensifer adhaerens TaxID=106592 RepID=UPI001C4DFBD5|nr:ArsO family NAD(P)H-dependent flavin-containing monooxygenase [Ensifer adhaerens]MBW0368317.1 NAD(P)/FAD-dependent oxidoreductase [Ensifer adhaerens]UCM24941.1 ArsO family NAD(P)H-dependent flavin-containing monooxygenase [Ensifer adhaerens]
MTDHIYDVIVIGAGQAGLASAYYLRRAGLDFVLIDAGEGPGGAWRHTWDSLRLFSPAGYSSLPGWLMRPSRERGYPSKSDVIDYLSRYEERYGFNVRRPVRVERVVPGENLVRVEGQGEVWLARAVLNATGTWNNPFVPSYEGQELFAGVQLHSADYRSPDRFSGQSVLVVGGGNSGAQIFAEVSAVADASWVTISPPTFLPDDVDGHVLFERATARVLGTSDGQPLGGLGDIVMVPPVKAARDRGQLTTVRPFERFTENGVVWKDGRFTAVDAVIWCTGFRSALGHLAGTDIVKGDGTVDVQEGQSMKAPRLFFVGYGGWTGPASATLIGAGRSARLVVPRIQQFLELRMQDEGSAIVLPAPPKTENAPSD